MENRIILLLRRRLRRRKSKLTCSETLLGLQFSPMAGEKDSHKPDINLTPNDLVRILVRQVDDLVNKDPESLTPEEKEERKATIERLRDRARQSLVDGGFEKNVTEIDSEVLGFYQRTVNQQQVRWLIRNGQPEDMTDEQYEDCVAITNSPVTQPDMPTLAATVPFPFSQIALSYGVLHAAVGLEVFRGRAERFGQLPTSDTNEQS